LDKLEVLLSVIFKEDYQEVCVEDEPIMTKEEEVCVEDEHIIYKGESTEDASEIVQIKKYNIDETLGELIDIDKSADILPEIFLSVTNTEYLLDTEEDLDLVYCIPEEPIKEEISPSIEPEPQTPEVVPTQELETKEVELEPEVVIPTLDLETPEVVLNLPTLDSEKPEVIKQAPEPTTEVVLRLPTLDLETTEEAEFESYSSTNIEDNYNAIKVKTDCLLKKTDEILGTSLYINEEELISKEVKEYLKPVSKLDIDLLTQHMLTKRIKVNGQRLEEGLFEFSFAEEKRDTILYEDEIVDDLEDEYENKKENIISKLGNLFKRRTKN